MKERFCRIVRVWDDCVDPLGVCDRGKHRLRESLSLLRRVGYWPNY